MLRSSEEVCAGELEALPERAKRVEDTSRSEHENKKDATMKTDEQVREEAAEAAKADLMALQPVPMTQTGETLAILFIFRYNLIAAKDRLVLSNNSLPEALPLPQQAYILPHICTLGGHCSACGRP